MTLKLITATGCCLLACLYSHAQVNPKIVPQSQVPKNVIATPVIKDIRITAMPPFYIRGDMFWVLDTRDGIVKSDGCVSNDNRYRWVSVNNGDGTVTISSQADNNRKLIYRDNQIRFQGEMRGQKGYFGEPLAAAGSSATGNRYISKWYLRPISGQEYWITASDRRDSIRVFIIPVTEIPFSTIAFSLGTLEGWNLAEGPAASHAFAGQPSSVNFIPFYDSPVVPAMPLGGDYWKDFETRFFSYDTKAGGKYINTSRPGDNRFARPDETKIGTLTSNPFFVCQESMNYRIGGTNDLSNTRFELLQKVPAGGAGTVSFADGTYRVVPGSAATGHNNDVTRKVVFDMRALKYAVCRIRIIDNSATGHIDVDDIAFGPAPREGLVGAGSEPNPANPVPPMPNKPIWGAVDMHTHPMSYLGMGGTLMHGRPDGDPNTALGNCNCAHGGWGLDNKCGNYVRAAIVNIIDHEYDQRFEQEIPKIPHPDHPHDGYPALVHWPVQSSMTHQQMWFEWIRRARDGGLKAIVALTVNSELLGRVLDGAAPYDDKTTADRQIDELIAFVRRHNDFMDTVTTAARMRRVVTDGKMAVIIGMEVDNLGNFYRNVPVSTAQIRAEITRLKNKGVRYIFPIHVTDNKFGGSAVYQELFNFSNKYATGQPLTGTIPPQAYPPVLPGNLFQVEASPDRRVTFRYNSGSVMFRTEIRMLIEFIEAGGLPIIPPELALLKPAVDPILLYLRGSAQFQLLKRIYLDPHPDAVAYDRITGGQRNINGLSPEGKFAIREMMRQGIMIDMDHAGEKSVSDMMLIAKQYDYPVNSGHNGLRGDNEKTRTAGQVDTIRQTGGMFGVGWEDNTATGFYGIYRSINGMMGGRNVAVGSDIDGYAATPRKPANSTQFINYTDRTKPDFFLQYSMPGSRSWNFNTDGMSHYGLMPDFFQAMKKGGADSNVLSSFFLAAEYFAQMWEKCERRAPAIPAE